MYKLKKSQRMKEMKQISSPQSKVSSTYNIVAKYYGYLYLRKSTKKIFVSTLCIVFVFSSFVLSAG